MSKDEKKDRLKGILQDLLGDDRPDPDEKKGAGVSQKIKGGNNNIQIAGNNNTIRKV